jgi:hypothetical protein
MTIREELIKRLFLYLDEHLDVSIKSNIPYATLAAVLEKMADFHLGEIDKIARDLMRPQARITSDHENPTPEDFMNALEKL